MKSICIASFTAFALAAGGASAATTINGSKSNSSDRYRSSEVDDNVAKCPRGEDFDKSNKTCRKWHVSNPPSREVDDNVAKTCPAGFDFDKSNKKCRAAKELKEAVKTKPYSSVTPQQGKGETALGGPDTSQQQ